jgi:hypothetical protein
MNDKETKEQEDNLSKTFIENIIRSLFKEGILTLSDLDNEKKLFNKLISINKKTEYNIIIDHTDNLISSARQFNEAGEIDNAKIFYATYFEHQINKIINEACLKKSINKKDINNIIKSINLIGKLTWLPLILGIPKISVKHKNVILKLADDRNAYIHYKHNPEPDELNENENQKQQEDIKQIEKTITYFKKYSSRILYNNQKTQLDKKLKKRKK